MRNTLVRLSRSAVVLLVVLGATVMTAMAADTYQFSWANPRPQGNALHSMGFEDGDKGLAVGDRGAVLRTVDRGRTWSDISNFKVFAADLRSVVAIGPGDYIAVGSSPGVFHTVDGGQNWTAVTNPSTGTLLSIEMIGPGTLFAIGENGQALRSDNGGATWALATSPSPMNLEGQFWWDELNGYVVGFTTAVRTTDGGQTWVEIPDPIALGALDMVDVHFEDADNGWILEHFTTYRTTDGGATWFKKHGLAGGFPVYQREAVFFDSSHRVIITLGEGAEIFETFDDGGTWSPRYQRLDTGGYADIDRLPDGTLVTCSSVGDLLRSSDSGQTWENTTHCPDDLDRAVVEAIAVAPGGLALAGGRSSLWLQSSDFGLTWEVPLATPSIQTAKSIVFRDDLFALAGGYTPTRPTRVSRTIDGGASWTDFELTGTFVGYPREIVIPGHSTGYVVTWGGEGENRVFRSDDAGETWIDRSPVVPTGVELASIFFLDTEIGFVAGGDPGSDATIWKTTNGGTSWIPVPELGLGQTMVEAMYWSDENTGLVSESRGIYRTTDGGDSWTQTLDVRCNALALADDLTGVAGSLDDLGVWTTEDGGLTWTKVDYASSFPPYEVAAKPEGFLVGGGASVILDLRPSHLIFGDGFGSGTTSAWSATNP